MSSGSLLEIYLAGFVDTLYYRVTWRRCIDGVKSSSSGEDRRGVPDDSSRHGNDNNNNNDDDDDDEKYVFSSQSVMSNTVTLPEILEIYWNKFSLLEFYWKLAKSPGNFLADSKFCTSQCTSKTSCSKPGLIDIGAINPR